MVTSRPRLSIRTPSLATKKLPAQRRATETYEHILEVTALMLGDVGIERLSTNLICERAGVTPPALYRYFPNKYAVLYELGQRLMQAQNERIPRWITPEVLAGTVADLEAALTGLVLDTYRVTKRLPGGVWVLRALRAVPALQRVRLDSHAVVAKAQARLLAEAFPDRPAKELLVVGRVAVDLLYAAVELSFDVPLNTRAIAKVAGAMVASHLTRLGAEQV
jgi:AcrR family transcriptional regulator